MPRVLTEDWRHGGFGVYIHWPFCSAKCPYCDFNSHVRTGIDQTAWRDALLAEIRYYAALTPARQVNSVFFGGGTPSLMPPQTVGSVIDLISEVWRLPDDAEITLEANPTSVESQSFAEIRMAGVNRLSLGIQALNDPDLKRLGRLHSVNDALRARDIARTHFDRVSFDLIYARQNQTPSQWEAELTEAIRSGPDHLSLYQMTIEPGTRFGELASRGKLSGIPPDSIAAEMFSLTQELCGGAGLNAYEVSNHALPGCESRHNLIYWRYGDYVGIGPGAHGRISTGGNRLATENLASPERWLSSVQDAGQGCQSRELIPAPDQAKEYMLMAMRLSEGADISRFEILSCRPLNKVILAHLEESGFIEIRNDKLRATTNGRIVLNEVIRNVLKQN